MRPDKQQPDAMPTVPRFEDFNRHSGNVIERIVFNNRRSIISVCLLISLLLGWNALQLRMNASFERMIPQSHPYIQNYLNNQDALRGLGDSVRIAVENTQGDIYDPAYLEVLRTINDRIFLLPGVDRAFMRSLWTPLVRWTEVTEEGFTGGPVMPESYDGSVASLAQLRGNVQRAGIVGSLVANDGRSSLVLVPLMERDPHTGEPLDYAAFSRALEHEVRSLENAQIKIHIIGFAKLAGDLIDGLVQVTLFFAGAALIALLIIYLYTRCVRSTLIVVLCSVVAVVWQLGVMQILGFVADPYSILVPFLVFAIGVSHGAQKMNGIMEDIGRGTHKYVAARYTFRRLFIAGVTALIADVVGFAVLTLIDIPVIRDLALSASIGIGILVFTNLLLLPILLSYTSVSPKAAARSLKAQAKQGGVYAVLEGFCGRRGALLAVTAAASLLLVALVIRTDLQIGDLDAGAPELRPDSRYNRDNQFITQNFGLSSDQFAVIVKSSDGGLGQFPTLIEEDRLEQLLLATPGVQTTMAAASLVRRTTPGFFEGNLKWFTLNRDPAVISDALNQVSLANPEVISEDRSVGTVIAYLSDHKAETLQRVVKATEAFAAASEGGPAQFLLAAGSSGIEAATNIVVAEANHRMLLLVYLAVMLLCFITFRSWRAVIVAVLPLIVTSILCEALMVLLDIGIKVATLPVIALGVGIGVDYALYLLSVQLAHQRNGVPLREAYSRALRFTGKVVALVGLTLAAGVVLWAVSPIKFQADMGILLTFMFLWNMVGALVLIPALSHFLLRTEHVFKPGSVSLTAASAT
ncbi:MULTISPECIES: MMPL family transporter [unclassified Pseudomonas]|uniref:efflux RND transporter permease subunit n=1 Tax=unclassified Pseudomonas TaxID=196821 RepID=UPI0024556788|nr:MULTISPECIES: MMPL family transporter [unclassified Pseudomonas]MDH4561230.1 RND family transporter [Pseudomonas sp. BN411]MDH4656958.1 RND family transporter [Pseudomonas sp. BN606]